MLTFTGRKKEILKKISFIFWPLHAASLSLVEPPMLWTEAAGYFFLVEKEPKTWKNMGKTKNLFAIFIFQKARAFLFFLKSAGKANIFHFDSGGN